MSAFGFLLVNDLKKFKNHLLEIKRKPWKLLIYISYIAWFGFIISSAFTNPDLLRPAENIEFKMDVFSVIVKTLVFLLFCYSLYSSTGKFDASFSMGDVHFLFPSPLSPRTILAYSMFKQSIRASLAGVFMLFLLPLLSSIYGALNAIGVVYALVGISSLLVFTVPFSYLTFILSTRFGMKEWLHYFLYGIVFFLLAIIGYGIYIQQDVLQGLFWAFNQPYFPYIPIIGWSSQLIQNLFTENHSLNFIFLLLQLLTIGITAFFAIFLARDYYEDAIPTAELKATLKKSSKEGKKISVSNQKNAKKKVRQVQVKNVGQGPWAFLWMQLVSHKRAFGSFFFRWTNLLLLIVSIAAGLLIPEKTKSVFFIACGIIAYFAFLMSIQISMDYELKMKYIFIVPGRPWKKIIAVNIVPVLKTSIYMTIALMPIGVLFDVPAFSLLSGMVFPISMTILNLFSTIIIHILIPSQFDLKAFFPVIRIFSFLFFLIPPAIVGIGVGFASGSVEIAFYSVAIINILMSILFVWISDRIFWKLELR